MISVEFYFSFLSLFHSVCTCWVCKLRYKDDIFQVLAVDGNLGMQSVHDIFVWPKKLSHDHIRQSNNKSMHVDAKLHIIARVHNWGFFWNDGPWMHHCQWTAAFDMTTKQSNMQTLVILKKKGSQFTCKGTLLVQPQYECRWTVSKKGEQKLEGKMHQQNKNLPQHEFLEAWLVNYFENVS